MNFRFHKLTYIAMLGAIVVALAMAACAGGEAPQERAFALQIQEKKLTNEVDPLQVMQGDTVIMNFDSDEDGSVHLHGYDIEKEVGPEGLTEFNFVADATGRFIFTFHTGGPRHEEEGDEHDGIDLGAHSELFESESLSPGDSFSFRIAEELHGATVPYHNHMNHEQTGSIVVDDETGLDGTIEIEVQEDGSFHPQEVTAKPGATVVWTSAGGDRQRIASGNPPTAEEHEEEEITLGTLEVRPR